MHGTAGISTRERNPIQHAHGPLAKTILDHGFHLRTHLRRLSAAVPARLRLGAGLDFLVIDTFAIQRHGSKYRNAS